jgi:dipeptidyl aminopeptidase/acylaminoacyl peptidase
MLNQFKRLLFVSVIVATCSCNFRSAKLIPIGDFFNSPDKTTFHISPDGKYISYLKRINGKQNIVIRSLADGTERVATSFSDYSARDYFWTYNNQIVVAKYPRSRNGFQVFAIDAATLQMHNLLSASGKVQFRPLTRNIKQPDILTFTMNQRDSSTFDVYRINTKTGDLKMYLKNPGNITQWYADPNGVIRLEKASDGVNEAILFRDNENSAFKPILNNNFKNLVEPIAFTGEKNIFYARSNVNRDKTALVEIDAENGKEQKVIFGTDKADIDEVTYSKSKQRLDMVAWQEAKPQKHFLNDNIKAIYADLEQQLPGTEIRISDRDTSEQNFIINTSNDRNPGSTYLYTVPSKKLTKLVDMNPGINQNDLCEMKPISFKARDSVVINGYLTLPRGIDPVNLPIVVIPHYDLWRRNNWGYSDEVQFLANRGYGVLQINYRGSTGYGKAFYSAGFKQMGGKMQQDITDGVKWLINQKTANPKKIAIFGSGFGGFSALYGDSFNPGLYNCVAVQSPLINFFTFIKDVPPYLKPKLSMLYEMVGSPETDADLFRTISPRFNTDKLKGPVLIYQDINDPRANINELNQFCRELQRRKVSINYQLVNNKNGQSSGPRERSRLKMFTELEKFLNMNLLGKK